MNKLLPIASLALIVGGLNAQGTLDVNADISLTANKVTPVVLKKQTVKGSAYARISDGTSRWRPDASASKSVRIYTSKYSGRTSVSVSDYASAAAANSAGVGKGSVTFAMDAGTKKVDLHISFYGRGTGNAAISGVKWTKTLTRDGKRVSDSFKGLTGKISVTFASDVSATNAKEKSYGSNSLSISVVPEVVMTKCTVAKGTVAGCNSITLAGTLGTPAYNRHVVNLAVAGPKSSWYLNLMAGADKGTQMANKCWLLDKPMWAGFGRTDSMGASKSRLYIRGNKAMTAAMQSAFFTFNKGLTLETSNSIVITCK